MNRSGIMMKAVDDNGTKSREKYSKLSIVGLCIGIVIFILLLMHGIIWFA